MTTPRCRYRDCRAAVIDHGGACARCQRIAERIRGQMGTGALPKPTEVMIPALASRAPLIPDIFLGIGRRANCDACGEAFGAISHGRREQTHDGRRFRFHMLCSEIWKAVADQ